MRAVVALLFGLLLAVPAFAGAPEPYVADCSSSVYGDLGREWKERALVAGNVAFVGMKDGYEEWRPPGPGSWPVKVLVVVEPSAAARVTIAARSRDHAALGYNRIRHEGRGVPLARGTRGVVFRACRREGSREPWNRGTQFAGYFLVAGARCVHVDVATQGRVLRRKLSFGARCA